MEHSLSANSLAPVYPSRYKNMTATTYHPQTSGQLVRYTKTIIAHLFHYVATYQQDWCLYEQHMTYVFNTQAHRLNNTTPFSLVFTRHHLHQPRSTIRQPLQLMSIMQETHRLFECNCSHSLKRDRHDTTETLTRHREDKSGNTTRTFVAFRRLSLAKWSTLNNLC